MNATPTSPAPKAAKPSKPPAQNWLKISVTWVPTEGSALLGQVSPDEQKAAEVIKAARDLGAVKYTASIGKKPFEG